MTERTVDVLIFSDNRVRMTLADGRTEAEGKAAASGILPEMIARLDRFVHRRPEDCEQADLHLIGRLLYETLFAGDATYVVTLPGGEQTRSPARTTLGALLLEELAKADSDRPFRIRLTFPRGPGEASAASPGARSTASELAHLPWELLCLPIGGGWVFAAGQQKELVLTRHLSRAAHPAVVPHGRERLRLWVGWAQPGNLGQLSGIESLARDIEARLGGGQRVELRTFPDLTHEQLRAALEAIDSDPSLRPDIIHLIAHGRYFKGKGEIALHLGKAEEQRLSSEASARGRAADPARLVDWVSAETLRDWLDKRQPTLFFLHSCNTGRAVAEDGSEPTVKDIRGAAERIADAGVPFVVAMQYAIANHDATVFAHEFYSQLGKGASVDEAVAAGRRRLGVEVPTWGHRRFATPVIYMGAEPGPLMAIERDKDGRGGGERRLARCPHTPCSRMIDLDEKFCSCDENRPFLVCPFGHASRPGVPECQDRQCAHRFHVPATTPAPSSLPPEGGSGAGTGLVA
jgi:hypothetical protein